MSHNVSNMGDVARMAMCRSARLHILGAEAEERSDEAHDAVLCEGLCHHFSKYIDVRATYRKNYLYNFFKDSSSLFSSMR